MDNTSRRRVQLLPNKGGRPEGALSKLSREAREKAKATGLLPHEFLLSIARGEIIYRDVLQKDGSIDKVMEDYDFAARQDAAKAAAPYYAPKISTVEVISGVADDQLDSIIAQLAAQAGVDPSAFGEGTKDEGEAGTD